MKRIQKFSYHDFPTELCGESSLPMNCYDEGFGNGIKTVCILHTCTQFIFVLIYVIESKIMLEPFDGQNYEINVKPFWDNSPCKQ